MYDVTKWEYGDIDNLIDSGGTVAMVMHCVTYLDKWDVENVLATIMHTVKCGRSDIIRAILFHPGTQKLITELEKIKWIFESHTGIWSNDDEMLITLDDTIFENQKSTDAFLVMAAFPK